MNNLEESLLSIGIDQYQLDLLDQIILKGANKPTEKVRLFHRQREIYGQKYDRVNWEICDENRNTLYCGDREGVVDYFRRNKNIIKEIDDHTDGRDIRFFEKILRI